LGVGLTTLPCKKENCSEASKKFSQILRRRPRPKLGCGAKERSIIIIIIIIRILDVRGRKWREVGEDWRMKIFITCTVLQILLG
jgi:hypothetical protein